MFYITVTLPMRAKGNVIMADITIRVKTPVNTAKDAKTLQKHPDKFLKDRGVQLSPELLNAVKQEVNVLNKLHALPQGKKEGWLG
jgi:hypothetical protein